MKARYCFTKKKFDSLPSSQQHKKCAEILRSSIEAEPHARAPLLKHYEELCLWMDFDPLRNQDLESLADRYHAHLQLSGLSLKEDRFLQVSKHDRDEPVDEPLDVTIYLENLRSAHNIGSILRSSECFGLRRIVLSPGMVGLTSRQVQRAAMGCENWIEILENTPLEDCPRPWIALETDLSATEIDHFSFPSRFTLVLGNEEYGCQERTLNRCDVCLRIPMHGRKNSLNVAAAFAATAYEIRRQWRLQPHLVN